MSADITNIADYRSRADRFTACELVAGGERGRVRIAAISARGARLETNLRFAVGLEAALIHPDVGAIAAQVDGHSQSGITVAFAPTSEASAFALAVQASEMARPQRAPRD